MVVRYQGGHNAGHTIVVDGAALRAAAPPVGDPLRPRRAGHRQRCRRRPGGPAGRDRRADGQGHRLHPAAGERQRPPDPALPPGDGLPDRAAAGAQQARHDPPRHRAELRRQGAAGRPPRAGPARRQDLPPEARPGAEGQERRPDPGVQPAAPRRRRDRDALPRRAGAAGGAVHRRHGRARARGARGRTSTSSSRARRRRSSTSTTGPTPSSRRPARRPAARARARASGPVTSRGSSGSPRRTAPGSVRGRSRRSCSTASATCSSSGGGSSARTPVAAGAPAGSTRSCCARPCA